MRNLVLLEWFAPCHIHRRQAPTACQQIQGSDRVLEGIKLPRLHERTLASFLHPELKFRQWVRGEQSLGVPI